MLRALVERRVAFKSIVKSRKGTIVARSCKSSVEVVLAGVAIESLMSSQLRLSALSTYASPMTPKAKSSPGESKPLPRVCPKAFPILGIKPGKVIAY